MVPQSVKFIQASLFRIQGVGKMKIPPMARGVLTYAVMWPTGCLIQQAIEGKSPRDYDWARALRFSLFGALYVAPTLYGWVRLTSAMWPKTNLRSGIIKAVTEQLSYGPFACVSFFMGMSLLEMKTFSQAIEETIEKAPPTYKVGVCIWPFLQTINFSLVPEHNRVVFVSICSLMWTIFLAYMKSRHENKPAVKQ